MVEFYLVLSNIYISPLSERIWEGNMTNSSEKTRMVEELKKWVVPIDESIYEKLAKEAIVYLDKAEEWWE